MGPIRLGSRMILKSAQVVNSRCRDTRGQESTTASAPKLSVHVCAVHSPDGRISSADMLAEDGGDIAPDREK